MCLVDTLVITPTLGSRKSLEQTILSVRLYGGQRVHHLIVGPLDRIIAYRQRYPWIHICNGPAKSGVYPALNHALRLHAHKYRLFAYINDDDAWCDGFTALFRSIDASESVDLVYGRVGFTGRSASDINVGPYFPFPQSFQSLLRSNVPLFTQQALLVKMRCMSEHGYFDEQLPLSADTALWSKMLSGGVRARGVDRICATYQLVGDRLSLRPDLLAADFLLRKKKRILSWLFIVDLFCELLYRTYNFPLYISRLIKTGSMRM